MKIITEKEVSNIVTSDSTVAIGGFGAYCCPDQLLEEIAESYRTAHTPSNLTVVTGIGTGDNTIGSRGLNRLGEEGLIGTLIAAHLANCPKIGKMVGDNLFPAYVVPLGVMAHLFRAIAGKQPGVLTHVGMNTFADPREEACCANQKAVDQNREIVRYVDLGDTDALLYRSFPLDFCLIRATYADEDGNLSFIKEALTGLELEMATAVHNCGGKVIVQVEQIVPRGSLPAKEVRIHHSMVDYVLVAKPEYQHQGYAAEEYRPELAGQARVATDAIAELPLDIKKVIARRGAMELKRDMVINLGIGIPSCVGPVANEEHIEGTTLSLESGPIGGVPVAGVGFAAAINAEMIASLADTFDMYDGGGLDMTCLGAAEIDRFGNVNVSKFNGKCTGPGGFINISQTTPEVCFLFQFTAGKSDIRPEDGKLVIVQDGKPVKFVKDKVQQITFSAEYAKRIGQKVLYITERAVFELGEDGLVLTEIAPGVDLQRDILDQMAFAPRVSEHLKEMDDRLFRPEPMGLVN